MLLSGPAPPLIPGEIKPAAVSGLGGREGRRSQMSDTSGFLGEQPLWRALLTHTKAHQNQASSLLSERGASGTRT